MSTTIAGRRSEKRPPLGRGGFAAVNGSSLSTAATMAKLAVPQMLCQHVAPDGVGQWLQQRLRWLHLFGQPGGRAKVYSG